MEDFHYDEPWFFRHHGPSAYLHGLRWLWVTHEGGHCSFHVEGLPKHPLDDTKGLGELT
jgi:hypothetical protein